MKHHILKAFLNYAYTEAYCFGYGDIDTFKNYYNKALLEMIINFNKMIREEYFRRLNKRNITFVSVNQFDSRNKRKRKSVSEETDNLLNESNSYEPLEPEGEGLDLEFLKIVDDIANDETFLDNENVPGLRPPTP